VRKNRETLKGGSSMWLCSEKEQGDTEGRQFNVAVQ